MKTILFALLLITSISSANAQLITDNLLLHYPLSGNANDNSGNGLDGSINNATLTANRYGTVNEAYAFNGSTSYIDLPNDASLKPQLPISIAFWVKFDNNFAVNSAAFTTDFGENTYGGVWISRSEAGNIMLSFGDNSGNTSSPNRRTKIGNTILQSNTWYHVAFTINSALDMEIYLNCENDGGTYSGTGGGLAYTTVAGSIGRKDANISSPANYFMGAIDEIYYWDRALTSTDIETLCTSLSVNDNNQLDAEEIVVYPNPSDIYLSIQGFELGTKVNYSIVNSEGKLLISLELEDGKINISDLTPGMYFLKLETENGVISKPFCKN